MRRRSYVAHGEIAPTRGVRDVAVASGWFAEAAGLEDGRRQLVGLFLPGDLISLDLLRPKGAVVIALTSGRTVAVAPGRGEAEPEGRRPLWFLQALAGARRDRELQQGRHIVRLGRMSAYERMADFIVELHARQVRAGTTDQRGIDFPITQEAVGDHLGLSIVHVNRTLQQLRRDNLIESRSGRIVMHDLEGLMAVAGIPAAAGPRLAGRPRSDARVVNIGARGDGESPRKADPAWSERRRQP